MAVKMRHTLRKLRASRSAVRAAALRQLRALLPPITPKLIFRALLGVLLFLCGIVYGMWLIIRFRHAERMLKT